MGVAAIAAAVLAPYDRGVATHATGNDTARPLAAATRPSVPPLEEFEPCWSFNLRRPLRDAAAQPSPLASSAQWAGLSAPPVEFSLAGTVVEPGRSVALLKTQDGRIQLKSVGEKVAGAEVLEIATDRVVVRHQGQPLTIKLDRPRKG